MTAAVPGRGKCGVVGTRFQIPGISLRLEPGSLDLPFGREEHGAKMKTQGSCLKTYTLTILPIKSDEDDPT